MPRFSELLARERDKKAKIDPGIAHLLPGIGGSPELKSPARIEKRRLNVEDFWLVTNAELHSNSSGLVYRTSPIMEEKIATKKEVWGTIIKGVLINDDWVRVGRLYLPVSINSRLVLVPTETDQIDLAGSDEDDGPPRPWTAWKIPKPVMQPSVDPGSGTLYEVMHSRIVGRPAPSFTAPMQCVKTKGDVLELFEFDESRKWRRGLDAKTNHVVWWLIDHENIGPLLRPKGKPFSVKPLEPLCIAAEENLIQDIQRFLDQGCAADVYDVTGRTPLMYAVERNHLECCILLVEGGASLRSIYKAPSSKKGNRLLEVAQADASPRTVALLKAMDGDEDYDAAVFDYTILFHLQKGFQQIVERLVEAAVQERIMGKLLDAEDAELEIMSADHDSEREASLESPAQSPRRQGLPHRVKHKVVYIRAQASTDAPKIGAKMFGDIVEIFEHDSKGDWARVEHEVYQGHFVPGWMLIRHPTLGELLEPLDFK